MLHSSAGFGRIYSRTYGREKKPILYRLICVCDLCLISLSKELYCPQGRTLISPVANSCTIHTVVVVVHGLSRNGDSYYCYGVSLLWQRLLISSRCYHNSGLQMTNNEVLMKCAGEMGHLGSLPENLQSTALLKLWMS